MVGPARLKIRDAGTTSDNRDPTDPLRGPGFLGQTPASGLIPQVLVSLRKSNNGAFNEQIVRFVGYASQVKEENRKCILR